MTRSKGRNIRFEENECKKHTVSRSREVDWMKEIKRSAQVVQLLLHDKLDAKLAIHQWEAVE